MTSNRETARFWLAQIRRQLEDQMTIRLLDAVDGQPTALTDFALYHRALHGGR